MRSVCPNFWRTASEMPFRNGFLQVQDVAQPELEAAVLGEGGDALGLGIEVQALEELEAQFGRLGPALPRRLPQLLVLVLEQAGEFLLDRLRLAPDPLQALPVVVPRQQAGEDGGQDQEQDPEGGEQDGRGFEAPDLSGPARGGQ